MAYQPAPPPAELGIPDATIPQVMAFRHESARTVQRKIANKTYESYKSGETRLILWSSVVGDRERCLKRGPQLSARPGTGKRRPGRPRKEPLEPKAAAPAE